jgi:hypothetical protein
LVSNCALGRGPSQGARSASKGDQQPSCLFPCGRWASTGDEQPPSPLRLPRANETNSPDALTLVGVGRAQRPSACLISPSNLAPFSYPLWMWMLASVRLAVDAWSVVVVALLTRPAQVNQFSPDQPTDCFAIVYPGRALYPSGDGETQCLKVRSMNPPSLLVRPSSRWARLLPTARTFLPARTSRTPRRALCPSEHRLLCSFQACSFPLRA